MLLYYELKKIFSGTGNRIALLFLTVFLGVSCYCAVTDIHVRYTNEQGEDEPVSLPHRSINRTM